MVYHHIATSPGQKVCDRRQPLSRKMWEIIKEELEVMLSLGMVEKFHSEWKNPIVRVAKPDGSTRFYIDFRKVNGISQFDAYPMPLVDELLE